MYQYINIKPLYDLNVALFISHIMNKLNINNYNYKCDCLH